MEFNSLNSVYSSFHNTNSQPNYVRSNTSVQSKNIFTEAKPIANLSISDLSSKEKKRNWTTIGISAAGALATLLVGSFMLTRGGSSKGVQKLNQWIARLDDKLYELSGKNKTVNAVQKFYTKCVSGLKKTLGYAKVSANITAAKDTAFRKCISEFTIPFGKHQIKPFKWFADAATRLSKKITMANLKKVSNTAIANADDLNAHFTKYADDILTKGANEVIELGGKQVKVGDVLKKVYTYNGKKYTGKQLLELLKTNSQKIKADADSLFNATSRNARCDSIANGIVGIENKVAESFKPSKFKATIKGGYITETLTEGVRTAGNKVVDSNLRMLTNGVGDMVQNMNTSLTTVRGQIAAADRKSLGIVRKLAQKIKEFGKLNGSQERLQREKLGKEILSLTEGLTDSVSQNSTYSKAIQSNLTKHIEEIQNAIRTDKKGALQEMQTILRILNESSNGKTYIEQRNKIGACAKSFRKAIGAEKEVYKRLGELAVGAAPTDFGFLTLGAGVAAYSVIKEDEKDKMVAASLTKGIPLLGTLGLCLFQTSKGMTGLLPLIIALIGGKLLNIAGTSISDRYLASVDTKKELMNELTKFKYAQSNTTTQNYTA